MAFTALYNSHSKFIFLDKLQLKVEIVAANVTALTQPITN